MPQPILGWLPKATCPAELSAAHQGSISWRVHPITRAGQGDRAELVNEHTSSPWRMAVTNKVNPDLAAALLWSRAAFQWLHKDIGQHPLADPKPAPNLKARWKSWLGGRGELRATAAQKSHLKLHICPCPLGKAPMIPSSNQHQLPGMVPVPALRFGSSGRGSSYFKHWVNATKLQEKGEALGRTLPEGVSKGQISLAELSRASPLTSMDHHVL